MLGGCSIDRVERAQQERLALVHRDAVATPFDPLIARRRNPRREIARQHGVQALAQQRGEGGRVAARRDRQRHAFATHHAAQERGRIHRIVDGVHEDAPLLRRVRDETIHLGRRRRDDQPRAVEIRRFEAALMSVDPCGANRRRDRRRDHANACAGREQLSELRLGHTSAADEQNVSSGQIQEQR